MSDVLLWLAIPLVLVPLTAAPSRLGTAAGQLIMAGLGLGALQRGAGTLDPGELRGIASQSPQAAWFVGMTVGMLLTGTCAGAGLRAGRRALLAVPLTIGLACSITVAGIPALLVGMLIGVVPATLARALPRPRSRSGLPSLGAPSSAGGRFASLILAFVAIAGALVGPILVSAVALCALCWVEWWRHRSELACPAIPCLPIAGTVLLGAWLWLALTIAGSPLIGIARFGAEAPVSVAANQLLATLAITWAIVAAAPWPLDRLADDAVQLPVVAVVLYLVARSTPDGIAHWQPLVTMVMVPVVLVAATLRRWDGAAAALMLLGATRHGPAGFAGALVMASEPAARRVPGSARIVAGLAGVAVAVLVATVLQDQVVLAVLLAFGVAVIAIRRDRLVAPV